MTKRKRRKRTKKRDKPIESLFEPNVNWKDVKKYLVIDVFEIIFETEYEIVEHETKHLVEKNGRF